MQLLKSFWRWLMVEKVEQKTVTSFPFKIIANEWVNENKIHILENAGNKSSAISRVYDPSQDEHKIMTGEMESYFE